MSNHVHNYDRVLFPSNQLACTICDEIQPPLRLFSLETFILPSGRATHFKIECDALTKDDWAALARLAVEILPPFSAVDGVPRGGILFADALEKYASPRANQLLIADDVWVTGLSMRQHRAKFRTWASPLGIVAFTRGVLDPWVKTLFLMHARAEEATYQLNRDYNTIQTD